MDPWMQHERGKSFAHRLGNWLAHDYVKKHSTEEILKESVRNIAQMMYDDIGEGLEYYRDKWPDHYPCIQEQAEFLAGGKEALLDCYEAFIIKHIGKPLEKYKKVKVYHFGTPDVYAEESDRYVKPIIKWQKFFQEQGIEFVPDQRILCRITQQTRIGCYVHPVITNCYLPQFHCYFMIANETKDFYEENHEEITDCAVIIAFGDPSDNDLLLFSESCRDSSAGYSCEPVYLGILDQQPCFFSKDNAIESFYFISDWDENDNLHDIYSAEDAKRLGIKEFEFSKPKPEKREKPVKKAKPVKPEERIYTLVSYYEKDQAKPFGARWDPERKSWYFLSEENKQEWEEYKQKMKEKTI